MLVKLESFIFLDDFVIVDFEIDFEVPIIFGRPFLATGRAMDKEKMKFFLNNEELTLNMSKSMRHSSEIQ